MSINPLQGAQFVLAAHRINQLPADEGAEVAFAGRSNAGKSSALNALTGHKGLARTSKTPGRTQQMVAFSLPVWCRAKCRRPRSTRLIDLPGYGYAKVPEELREHWRQEIDRLSAQLAALRGVVLIVDIRHPLKEFDRMMLEFCFGTLLALPRIADQGRQAVAQSGQPGAGGVAQAIGCENACVTAQIFSSSEGTGVEEGACRCRR
jgi:GTP-binding protein